MSSLPFLDFIFFKNFECSYSQVLLSYPLGGSTLLFWGCLVVFLWFLLLVNGPELMLCFALIRYTIYVLNVVFKLFFPIFLLYRLYHYPELLAAWDLFLPYVLFFTVLSSILFLLLQLKFFLILYNLFINLYLLIGLSFLFKFFLGMGRPELFFINFIFFCQTQGTILFPLLAEACFCFSLAACFYSLALLSNKINDSIRWVLVGASLLSFCGFFVPFSPNVVNFLFPFTGFYFGVMMLAIVAQYSQNQSVMWVFLSYGACLAFNFFIAAMALVSWSTVLAESYLFLIRSFHSYAPGSDESLACLYLGLSQSTHFGSWEHYLNLNACLPLVFVIALLYSILAYNMMVEQEPHSVSLVSLHISVAVIVYFLFTGVIVLGPTASCTPPPVTPEAYHTEFGTAVPIGSISPVVGGGLMDAFEDGLGPRGSAKALKTLGSYAEGVPVETVSGIATEAHRVLTKLDPVSVDATAKRYLPILEKAVDDNFRRRAAAESGLIFGFTTLMGAAFGSWVLLRFWKYSQVVPHGPYYPGPYQWDGESGCFKGGYKGEVLTHVPTFGKNPTLKEAYNAAAQFKAEHGLGSFLAKFVSGLPNSTLKKVITSIVKKSV